MYKQSANFALSQKRSEKGVIQQLWVHKLEADQSLRAMGWYSKQAVIDSIKQGNTFMTVTIKDGVWMKGADVHLVKTSKGEYLRTDRNLISSDNLDNLPEG